MSGEWIAKMEHRPKTTRTTKQQEVAETFSQQYELVLADVMLAMERDSCGSDYGGTSWTTRAEADHMGRLSRTSTPVLGGSLPRSTRKASRKTRSWCLLETTDWPLVSMG